jgi:hypothetical protein
MNASPMSRSGNMSMSPPSESGSSLLTTLWSSGFDRRSVTKLLHWLRIVLLTSEGR